MCHRITPLLTEDLQSALDELHRSGHARIPRRDDATVVPDAYPGTQLPLFTLDARGDLQVSELVWGFDAPPQSRSKLVFNTRIETALAQARSGHGLWAQPLLTGRCLVPVSSFYESWTRSAPERGAQVRFTIPGRRIFLLAGVCDSSRFSIVTTEPNADVGAVHSRMPLVLAPGESSIWLGPEYASLSDRSGITLDAVPELRSAAKASANPQLPL
ncbi:MAG: SOS response-associated peptidase family protein [Atopobiaceae bacterium]|nr:SOS response-associated peptidase family protein [Atopobiaceae bacterium]